MSALKAIFHILAAIGVCVTGVHVLPNLWATNVLDCVIVGSALFVAIVMMITKALTGEYVA